MEIRSDMVHFLRERAEDKGEERKGGSLDEVGVWAAVFPKGEKEKAEGGSGIGDEVWGSRADRIPEKKEKRTVHKDGECSTMLRPHKNGELEGPTQMAFIGHTAK